jgi:dUTP pyrophosphatase
MIKFTKLYSDAKTPERWSDWAVWYDLCSTENYTLQPMERYLFKTNIAISLPAGVYWRVAPRSWLSFKKWIDVMAGVIDTDYRWNIWVILINLGNEPVEIVDWEKIAQLILENYSIMDFVEVTSLDETTRWEWGYGSTGKF